MATLTHTDGSDDVRQVLLHNLCELGVCRCAQRCQQGNKTRRWVQSTSFFFLLFLSFFSFSFVIIIIISPSFSCASFPSLSFSPSWHLTNAEFCCHFRVKNGALESAALSGLLLPFLSVRTCFATPIATNLPTFCVRVRCCYS